MSQTSTDSILPHPIRDATSRRAGPVAFVLAILAPCTALGADECLSSQEALRPPVPIVLHAVRCQGDLLQCDDLHVIAPEFDAMDSCEYFAAGFLARAELGLRLETEKIMARCRYAPWIARAPGRGGNH